jgi:hypothetical protein
MRAAALTLKRVLRFCPLEWIGQQQLIYRSVFIFLCRFVVDLDHYQMMNLFNAQERTLPEFLELGKAAGWKFEAKKFEQPLVAIVFSAA